MAARRSDDFPRHLVTLAFGDETRFREGYPAAVLFVHAGNRPDIPGRADERFPVQDVAPVRACVHRLIDVLSPTGVVSAASAGADLIVLEAALELAVPVHVVVPIERTEFVVRSVADAGAVWVRRFDHVVRAAADAPNTLFEARAVASDGWERRANAVIIERARHLAGTDGRVLSAHRATAAARRPAQRHRRSRRPRRRAGLAGADARSARARRRPRRMTTRVRTRRLGRRDGSSRRRPASARRRRCARSSSRRRHR